MGFRKLFGREKRVEEPTMDATTAGYPVESKKTETESNGHDDRTPPPPPAYEVAPATQGDQKPQRLMDDVKSDIRSLQVGDPNEMIAVPMIHSMEQKSLKHMFGKNGGNGDVVHTVLVRKMPRERYLKHYAKDAEGNYVGTEKPAVDAGLVFVPSKGTPEDILQQVRKVAFGKEHDGGDFGQGQVMNQMFLGPGGGGA